MNCTTGRRIINEAKRILEKDAISAYEDSSHNIAIRRAQEVVELALKGILKVWGYEYPKNHDVGNVFVASIGKFFPEFDKDDVRRISQISERLAADRQPSFYFEKVYTRENACKAIKDAGFVLDFVEMLLEQFVPNLN